MTLKRKIMEWMQANYFIVPPDAADQAAATVLRIGANGPSRRSLTTWAQPSRPAVIPSVTGLNISQARTTATRASATTRVTSVRGQGIGGFH